MIELEDRKNKLKDVALNMQYCNNGGMIYKLINEGVLDNAIKMLDDKSVDLKCSSIVKKGYLTANEQFVDMLNNFIHYLDFDFSVLGSRKVAIIEALFENSTPKFVLCKNYWGDNAYIPYFTFNIRKFIVQGFYENIKILFPVYKELFKENGISNKLNLKKEKDLEKIYYFLKDILWCNYDYFGNYFLFLNMKIYDEKILINDSKKQELTFNYYKQQWDTMISNYNKKILYYRKIMNN